MPRRGPKKGDRRIDAALDHFAGMGYDAREVRAIVQRLLKLYGGADAWPLLEEGSYQVVQDVLFEKQEEEEEKQLLLEHHPQEEEQQVEVGEEPPKHQGPAVDEAPPENNMAMFEVYNEVSAEPDSPIEGVEDSVFADLPTPEVVVPPPVAVGTGGTARPCYGWISESEDEEEITGEQPEEHVLSLEGGSPSILILLNFTDVVTEMSPAAILILPNFTDVVLHVLLVQWKMVSIVFMMLLITMSSELLLVSEFDYSRYQPEKINDVFAYAGVVVTV
ncbi:hypothetical protein EJB05_44332 [Eragrostis curvula]|uniref:WIYLD domain-containing protein n=1 Tax=Eragrostis curvula TaxID=38414 RepID=A0A5J9THN2_9POAL|nr:hypothetical protein EJB05_44332 [Eragrostis curvula]